MQSQNKMTIHIKVNGQALEVNEDTTLSELCKRMGIPEAGTAVEIAGDIVTQAQFKTTQLAEGQSVEIVRLVGGG